MVPTNLRFLFTRMKSNTFQALEWIRNYEEQELKIIKQSPQKAIKASAS